MLLKSKVAIVTGAGRGIGAMIAQRMAAEGAKVMLVSRTEGELRSVADMIKSRGGEARIEPADVTDPSAPEQVIAATLAALGRIDILVNNAGYSHGRPFLEIDEEEWTLNIETNLGSVYRMCRAAVPHMVKQAGGSIVNIASGAGQRGLPENAAYSAAKAGVIALTHSVAEEFRGTGVRANVVCPGPVETESSRDSPNRAFHQQMGHTRMSTEDVAGAVLYFSSDLSGAVTSQVVSVRDSNRW